MRQGTGAPHLLEQVREVWSRRKWLAMAVFAVAAAAGVTFARSLPNVYRATATVLVEEPSVEPTVAAELDRRLQLISQEILSRSRLDAIARRFGLYPRMRRWASADAVVDQMRRDVRTQFQASALATGAGGTITVAVGYRGTDPATVAAVANALAGLYVQEDRKLRERQASGTVTVLQAQLEELRRTLDAQEGEVATFQEQHQQELPQQSEANLAALEQLHAELRATSDERMRALDRRNDLLRRLAEVEDVAVAPAAGSLPVAGPRRADRLRQELAELQRRFSDRYPDVMRLKAELAAAEREPEPAPAWVPAATPAASAAGEGRAAARLRDAVADVDRQIEQFRSDEARLRAGIGGYIQRLENAPRRQRALQEISRDYQTTRDLYDTLRKRYEQAQLEEGTQAGDAGPRFRILDPAVAPAQPAAPDRLMLLLFAVAGALAAAAAAALAAERLDTSFKDADDVRDFTPVPVLVSIPRMASAADRRASRRRFCLAAASVVLALGLAVHASREMARDNDALVSLVSRSRS